MTHGTIQYTVNLRYDVQYSIRTYVYVPDYQTVVYVHSTALMIDVLYLYRCTLYVYSTVQYKSKPTPVRVQYCLYRTMGHLVIPSGYSTNDWRTVPVQYKPKPMPVKVTVLYILVQVTVQYCIHTRQWVGSWVISLVIVHWLEPAPILQSGHH